MVVASQVGVREHCDRVNRSSELGKRLGTIIQTFGPSGTWDGEELPITINGRFMKTRRGNESRASFHVSRAGKKSTTLEYGF